MPLDKSFLQTVTSRARRRSTLPLAVAVALLGFPAAGRGATHLRNPGKLVPPHGALVGAFVNPHGSLTVTPEQHRRLVRRFEAMIGRKLDVEMWYYRWGKDFWHNVPAWDLATGRIPLVKYGAGGGAPSLDSIIDGARDDDIRRLAAGARSLRKPFFFAPFWEMNGSWESWNGVHTSDPGTHNGPSKYVRAWRHMHRIFTRQRARNVVWVWSPDRGDTPKASWNHWLNYYPGDRYVDWVGMDGYNWGAAAEWSRWTSWDTVFRPLYADFAARKPVMVTETASTERGGDKARWIGDARATIKARFPQLGAVVWFDDDKETDWRVNSSPRSLAAYRSWVHDRYFHVAHKRGSVRFRSSYRLRRALRRGVTAIAGSLRPFRVELRARVSPSTARRLRLPGGRTIIARGRASAAVPGTRRVNLGFTRRARGRLDGARRLTVHVSVRVRESGRVTATRHAFVLAR